jgi:maltose O-acetyltransferase
MNIYKILYILTSRFPNSSFPVVGNIAKHMRGRVYKKYSSCYVNKNINIERNVCMSNMVSIDEKSGIGGNSVLHGKVSIGKNVMIGPELYCFTVNHNFSNCEMPMIEQGFSEMRPITISDDVWIGARVTILPGVTVGKGAVLGAGSVVKKIFQTMLWLEEIQQEYLK